MGYAYVQKNPRASRKFQEGLQHCCYVDWSQSDMLVSVQACRIFIILTGYSQNTTMRSTVKKVAVKIRKANILIHRTAPLVLTLRDG